MAPPPRRTDSELAESMRDVGPAGIVLFEAAPPFRVVWTNKAYLELWPEPLRSRGLVGLALSEFIADAEETGVAEVFRQVAGTRAARHIQEFRYELADGTHWFDWSLSPVVRDGEVVALTNMAVDITREVLARKEAERARDEQRDAAELLELGDAFCELDSDFRLVRVNAQQEKLTGIPRAQSLGKTHWELWPETGHPDSPWWREYHRCMTERVPVEFENYYAPLELWSHVTCYPTRSGGIAMFFRDVTTRKRAEAALLAANEKLRDADRRKDEFLGMLSHELRNPLAPIRTSTFVLQRTAPGSEQARRAQAVIERQTEHLTRLVDDLLDVTRIARGKIELRRSRVDLRDVVVRAAEDFRWVMEERGVVLRTVTPDAEVWCEVDATRMTQVVGNLLHNAAKFTRRGDEVFLTLSTGAGDASITVRDTGLGIDAALLPIVFEPFVQGERTLARTDGGLGLGLALVKGITELHGGSVEAASAGAGRGAEFVVRLPLGA